MGSSASVLEKLTPEQQAEINALVEKLKGEGVAEEEIEKQVKEQFAEILASIEVAPAAEAEGEGAEGEGAEGDFQDEYRAYIKPAVDNAKKLFEDQAFKDEYKTAVLAGGERNFYSWDNDTWQSAMENDGSTIKDVIADKEAGWSAGIPFFYPFDPQESYDAVEQFAKDLGIADEAAIKAFKRVCLKAIWMIVVDAASMVGDPTQLEAAEETKLLAPVLVKLNEAYKINEDFNEDLNSFFDADEVWSKNKDDGAPEEEEEEQEQEC